jgi:uncharacterized protein (TIGR03503 family)
MHIKDDKIAPFTRGWRRPMAIWLGLVCLCLSFSVLAAKPVDVRTVIDISGSMKKNDPKNLRQPALRMLVGLMPDGTHAGVWTFGQYVNMEVKWGKVDKQWKEAALKAAGNIDSRGLYTNIEEALRKATRGWEKPDHRRRRHLVLLTDGHVDISKDKAVNDESRRRILQEVLPGLEDSNVTIHSIALSKNVDFELLYALSGATDGWYEQINSAKELPKVFLRIFEKAVVPDALPLKDNRFKVDKSISDVTVLLFRKDKSQPTRLVSPDGKSMTADKHPAAVNWRQEGSYDLINISKPQVGEWNVKADVDPDNRVLIVTNLQLAVDKLPTNLMLGDRFDVKARLQEKGKTLNQGDLLKLLNFETRLNAGETELAKQAMLDDGNKPDVLAQDGVYSTGLKPLTLPGKYELLVNVSGGGIEREFRHTLQVYDTAANIEIIEKPDAYNLIITPHAGLLRTETVSMQLQLPDGKKLNFQQINENDWQAKVAKTYKDQIAKIVLTGTRYNNQSLTQTFEQPISPTQGKQALKLPVHHKKISKKKTVEHKLAGNNNQPQTKSNKELHKADEEGKGFDWTFVVILIIVINVVVGIGGGVAYFIWKKRKVNQLAEEDKEMAL